MSGSMDEFMDMVMFTFNSRLTVAPLTGMEISVKPVFMALCQPQV